MKILIFILLPFVCFCQVKIDKTKSVNISKSINTEITRDKKVIYVGQTYGDFDNVQEALNSIADASISKVYTIKVDTGTYAADQITEYNLNGSTYSIFKTEDYINIQGAGIDATIFDGSLPDTTTATTGLYSTIDFYGTNTVSNMTVKAHNVKYAIHDDFGSANKTVNVSNVKLIHFGNMSYYNYWLPTVKPIYDNSYGCGTESGRVINFSNVTFDSRAYFHTNKNFATRSKMTFDNCVFIPRDYNVAGTLESGIIIQPINSLKSDTMLFTNCALDSMVYNWYMYQSDTALMPYDLAEVKVVSDMVFKFNNYGSLYTTNGSLMIVADDSIRFVSGSNVIRNPINYGDTLISKLEVGEWPARPNSKMGVRLGDCSSVNKTINLVVNGTPQTITFNENFTTKTNTYILSFINSQLTGAVASLYSWGSYYNPF